MKSILKYLVVTALLSMAAFAQTTIVEYSAADTSQNLYGGMTGCVYLTNGLYTTCSSTREVTRLEKFDTLEEAMQFMANHQEYKLLHFYSALIAVFVTVEEKTFSEPQPPIKTVEKVYKYGSLTKKRQAPVTIDNSSAWIHTVPYSGTVQVVK